ncbi:alcohol dehydrogenase catalytic domain-containing protein [Dictyobacter kobayashii]|uniref:Uncharacterized protein n=1 Tax=Dictyobacter kobayashii TaxID=2014872 RepID=A0A402AYN0_9CHLR|nr:alcohol dehydrogenase catalytic domain-containing protein [Dictyobacter kobayashii]GCE24204.1 hypothetical protein KDK_80040 [Dictyobacter kobayashii]
MKAIIIHDGGDIRLEEVPDPEIEQSHDAIVRLTASSICDKDLNILNEKYSAMIPENFLEHEGVGIVEQLGAGVNNLNIGDRVIVPSIMACGSCSHCRADDYAHCDQTNPNERVTDASFFNRQKEHGPWAEKVRVPLANINLLKLPDPTTDNQAMDNADTLPTRYSGDDKATTKAGHTVAVFGCGPVGLLAIARARLLHTERIFAIDTSPERLQKAKELGAEIINCNREDPIKAIKRLTAAPAPIQAVATM